MKHAAPSIIAARLCVRLKLIHACHMVVAPRLRRSCGGLHRGDHGRVIGREPAWIAFVEQREHGVQEAQHRVDEPGDAEQRAHHHGTFGSTWARNAGRTDNLW